MYNIAIFTAGNIGKRIFELIKNIAGVNILAFVDNNANLYAKKINQTKIISPYSLKKRILNKEIDFVLVPSHKMYSAGLREYILQLERLGIENYKVVPSWVARKERIDEHDVAIMKHLIFNGEYKKINQLQHLQFHVVDNCNLNCKRCQHFSNLATPKSYAKYESLSNDFLRLSELFDDIGRIVILGGEPLLNPELSLYCSMVRKTFEHSQIEVITNGLLVRQMSESLIDAIKDNDIIINISYYPVLEKTIEEIAFFLAEKKIRFFISSHIDNFSKKLMLEKQADNIDERFLSCRDACCTTLRNGRIYPCYLPATVHLFNEKFNQNIDIEDSSIDIYDKQMTGEMIVERLKSPFEICKYCGTEKLYKWEQDNDATQEDWLI